LAYAIVWEPVAQDLIFGKRQAGDVGPRLFAIQRQDSRRISPGAGGFVSQHARDEPARAYTSPRKESLIDVASDPG